MVGTLVSTRHPRFSDPSVKGPSVGVRSERGSSGGEGFRTVPKDPSGCGAVLPRLKGERNFGPERLDFTPTRLNVFVTHHLAPGHPPPPPLLHVTPLAPTPHPPSTSLRSFLTPGRYPPSTLFLTPNNPDPYGTLREFTPPFSPPLSPPRRLAPLPSVLPSSLLSLPLRVPPPSSFPPPPRSSPSLFLPRFRPLSLLLPLSFLLSLSPTLLSFSLRSSDFLRPSPLTPVPYSLPLDGPPFFALCVRLA